jgi:hypothetical protein
MSMVPHLLVHDQHDALSPRACVYGYRYGKAYWLTGMNVSTE